MQPSSDHPFFTTEVTAAESAAGALVGERLDALVTSLRVHGAAVVLGAVDLDHCDRLYDAMIAELDEVAAKPRALDVPGHLQHNPPPRAEHLYIDIFANPIALSVARALLGSVLHLSLYTGNTMLGHTTQQQPVHWDEAQLWPSLSEAPPPASLIVNVPLVDVTVDNGAIELWPGTHRDVRSGDQSRNDLVAPEDWLQARSAEVPPVRVPVQKGALLLRDGRMWHRGTTNSTDQARPMVAMLYTASWYRPYVIDFYPDAKPILKQAGIRVTARYREKFDHHAWPPNWELIPKPVD